MVMNNDETDKLFSNIERDIIDGFKEGYGYDDALETLAIIKSALDDKGKNPQGFWFSIDDLPKDLGYAMWVYRANAEGVKMELITYYDFFDDKIRSGITHVMPVINMPQPPEVGE